MLDGVIEKPFDEKEFLESVKANIVGYIVLDTAWHIKQTGGKLQYDRDEEDELYKSFPILNEYKDKQETNGAFYRDLNLPVYSETGSPAHTVFIDKIPDSDDIICIVFDIKSPLKEFNSYRHEVFILSLISQAVRAFNQADNLETILKIVLIGVTAGSGLGFNRAFILLTCDDQCCLRGALANGPSSPEEAHQIWNKLSSGEITLEQMFNFALNKEAEQHEPLSKFLSNIAIPLADKNNIFARAALEKKSMIIDEVTMTSEEYSDLHSKIGPGPLAVVPLIGKDYLQGVLIADNFITRKEITENDLHLLEIFARYASDSIKNFRLYESLEKKINDLKEANEIIINSRENVIKAEKLTVLANMAGEVAHEIRNPLTIIGGFTKSMLKNMTDDDQNYEYLNIIFEQVERISQSLEKFTSLMNYEISNDKVCDLRELVRSALQIRMRGQIFSTFNVVGDNLVKVRTDPDLLRQALIIILNHINMINDKPMQVNLVVTSDEHRALIYFDSNGFEGKFAETIYRSFYTGGGHERLKQLSTTLEILKYYRGNIGLEAQEKMDNRFYIELPVFKEDQ